ncbi:MAG: selenide, water dikinase [Monoraphidium minutum]|nr:MAG: selenide, water dikinase [Monoraphidium minutum]
MLVGKPIVKELVLLGGGHSHVEVLRSFGMRPVAGVRLTLVTRDVHTPYSGMLPGYVSGFYSYDDCHIDLARLAAFASARLIHAEACGIDPRAKRVAFRARPSLPYDALSVDIGISPGAGGVPGALEHTTPVKPINRFVERFDALLARVRASRPDASGGGGGGAAGEAPAPVRVAVVGGGAGGVELALALQYRLAQEAGGAAGVKVSLFCRGELLPSHPPYARRALLRLLQRAPVAVHEGTSVAAIAAGRLELEGGGGHAFDECLWCTQAAAAGWLAQTGLPLDDRGFLLIDEFLRADGGPGDVFAVGDVATSRPHPRPKAGVFAVRQGPPLADNLRRLLTGQPLQPFTPQSSFLSLISAGGRYAVGTKGWAAFEGAWAWGLKDYIDRSFMAKYGSDLPFERMQAPDGAAPAGAGAGGDAYAAAGPEGLALLAAAKMRCGGCGAKVGAAPLSRALARLADWQRAAQEQAQAQQQQQQQVQAAAPGGGMRVLVGVEGADDAAVVSAPPPGHVLVQTADFFRSFWGDPFLFGRIAALHALGDVFAMGAAPAAALALAVVPHAPEAIQEEELFQMLAGAAGALADEGCALAGGHSCEGAELSLGFSVTGHAPEGELLRKSGLAPGDALILTKPLGTGAILAAAMRGAARGRWVSGALDEMGRGGGGRAAAVLRGCGARAATDVTGFGLLGHALEMARASQVVLTLDLDALPALPGALEAIAAGHLSSLHPQNAAALGAVVHGGGGGGGGAAALASDPRWPLLVDPQTAGGLLAGVPAAAAAACVARLRAEAGCGGARVVGRVAAAAVAGDERLIRVELGGAEG